ncbi:MAG: thiamine-phosphate kinase, partial [Rickettsiales bacterium]
LNLSDDAAIISPPAGCELVITKDAISEGIHFIGSESPDLIAGKALRVNLSDLAAMGAQPLCYFLALMLPKNTSEQWLEKFAGGLKKTGEEFKISLAGGDTTATNGSLSISITAIGSVPRGTALRRNGAKMNDDIYVSGTLGDSALGLQLLLNPTSHAPLPSSHFINRYLTPQPRISLGIALRDIATACMDISDGLAQDLGHICTASSVGAVIYANQVPLASLRGVALKLKAEADDVAIQHLDITGLLRYTRNDEIITALTGGDDYELLFTVPPAKKSIIEQLAKTLGLPLTCIGKITEGNNVKILDENGKTIELNKKGFSHF